jgi:PST family polysaccharide transporter
MLLSEEVNAQTEIAMLLAVPGLAATIIFAPLAITIFYTGKFEGAVDILRWSVYGIFGRVISWPLGFIMLAKGMGKVFFCTEALANVFYLLAIWFGTRLWGLPGTGIAFMLLYLVYIFVVYIVANKTSGMTWTRSNMIHMLAFGAVLILVGGISFFVKSPWYQFPASFFVLAATSSYCARRLSEKSGITFRSILNKVFQADK